MNTPSYSHKLVLAWLAAAVVGAVPAIADVQLPKIFSDNMMLQRDLPVRVWGSAEAGEKVTATFSGKTASTTADEKGAWKLELPALKTGENLELEVKGKNSVTLKNIVIGDIWVCSGQSNMEMALNGCLGAAEDVKAANLPLIRRIKLNHLQAGEPASEVPAAGPWEVCAPETAGRITAVGFYFAREIQAKTGVPIGIIDVNWGGTKIEPWVATEGLGLVDEFKPAYAAKMESLKAAAAPVGASPAKTGAWSGMYNAMIHPIVRLPIKGALWYQGESNGVEGDSYYKKMCALIGGWRKNWGQGDFPFYYVQLANYDSPKKAAAPGSDGWAKLREAQTKALSIPKTGMAVIIDTVPLAEVANIHPKNKYDVGMRLARWALNRDYGQKQLEVSGPLYKELKINGAKAVLTFDHAGGGLMVGKKEGRDAVVADKAGKLGQFSIAGEDKKWVPAEAVIEKGTVVVSSPEVKAPVAVRYAYVLNADGANLYNADGLPASPFRTDSW